MLVPHLYLNGKCEEAIAQYVRAFGTEVKAILPHPGEDHKSVMHAEITIHGQRVMLNDYDYGSPTLVVIFDSEEELRKSYEVMGEESQTLSPMQATSYTSCQVEFVDKYGVKWGFMVGTP